MYQWRKSDKIASISVTVCLATLLCIKSCVQKQTPTLSQGQMEEFAKASKDFEREIALSEAFYDSLAKAHKDSVNECHKHKTDAKDKKKNKENTPPLKNTGMIPQE